MPPGAGTSTRVGRAGALSVVSRAACFQHVRLCRETPSCRATSSALRPLCAHKASARARSSGRTCGRCGRAITKASSSFIGNTADEANAVAELMRTRGRKRIILVTTGWHMPRAAWLFRQVGVECTIFPVDFGRDRTRPNTLLDFLPRADALWDTETALREISGYLFYRLFH